RGSEGAGFPRANSRTSRRSDRGAAQDCAGKPLATVQHPPSPAREGNPRAPSPGPARRGARVGTASTAGRLFALILWRDPSPGKNLRILRRRLEGEEARGTKVPRAS